jgi:MraZ protein
MFIGEYAHTIDTKRRLAMPAKFRGEMGDKVVVTRGLDQCLFVYTMKAWERLAEKLGTLPIGEANTRSFTRLMLAGAVDVEVDSQGRVLLPEYLKVYAHLDRDVTVAGVFDRLEIWDTAAWNTYKATAESQSGEIAEQLGKLGVY